MVHFYQRKNDLTEEISKENFFQFAEIITLHNLKVIGLRCHMLYHLYNDLLHDIHCGDKLGYIYSDAFDIVQEVAYTLYNHLGKTIHDVAMVDKKGKQYTVRELCNRVINQMTYKVKRDNNTTCPIIDNLDTELIYEPEFDEKEEDYTNVDKILEQLELAPIEVQIIRYIMSGMRHMDIVSQLRIHRSMPWNVRLKAQTRLRLKNITIC